MEAVDCACGLLDCAAVKQSRLAEEAARVAREQRPAAVARNRILVRRLEKRKAESGKAGNKGARCRPSRPAVATLSSAANCLKHERCEDLSTPREPDFDPRPSTLDPVIGSSQKEFHAAVDVSAADQVLLAYFKAHFGEWVPMVELAELSGCHALHSRIPEVRGLLEADQDIDQQNRLYAPTGRLHSHYRLCRKSESERLKRKARKEAEQPEFLTADERG